MGFFIIGLLTRLCIKSALNLVEPEEVASLVGEPYKNEALADDVYFIHGGLRLGSRG